MITIKKGKLDEYETTNEPNQPNRQFVYEQSWKAKNNELFHSEISGGSRNFGFMAILQVCGCN